MIPTEEWIFTRFNEYNDKYFDGELPTPNFKISQSCKIGGNECFGYYNLAGCRYDKITRKITSLYNNGTICLSNQYDRPENEWIETLLHEMVHEYVNLCLYIYPRDPHGKKFQQVAERINADGWNISESAELGADNYQNNPNNGNNGGQQNINGGILCFIKTPGGGGNQFWLCRAEDNNMDDIRSVVGSWADGSIVRFFQTQSVKLFNLDSNPNTLNGFGGSTYNEAVNKLANYLGDDPSKFSGQSMTEI